MAGKLDVSLVRKAVRSGASGMAQRVLEKLGTAEIAHLLTELSPHELRVVVAELLRARRLVATFAELPDDLLLEVTQGLDEQTMGRILSRLELDEATRLAHQLEPELRRRVLAATDPVLGEQIERLLRYEPDSAGGRMTPRFLAVSASTSVGQAIHAVREADPDIPLYYLYIVDDYGTLNGVVSLGQLVKSRDNTPLYKLMVSDVVAVKPDADQEEVARVAVRYNLLAVPVVERDGSMVGLVTIDDVLDVVQQEATEDMYRMAGLSEGDRVFSPPHRSLVKRLPWNALNLGTSLLAASAVALFEDTIGKMVALAVFMPVVAGIGGNTGNQTLTVIIRGIALGELEFSSAWRAVLKEVVVGFSIGVILGSAAALIAILWKGNPVLGLVVGLAMNANLVVAALVGTAIPLTLKRLGYDPALGGSILVTMCTDVFGFISFLGLATLLMKYMI